MWAMLGEMIKIKIYQDEARWKNVIEAVNARKRFLKNTKYDAILINFPADCGRTFGYHTKCYKNFTAISKATRATAEDHSEETNVTRPKRSESQLQRGSSSGVLVP